MNISKDFFTTSNGDEVYEHRATIGGEVLHARLVLGREKRMYGGPDLNYIDSYLRNQIMRAIEQKLYKGYHDRT